MNSQRAARFVLSVSFFLMSIPLLAHHGGSEYDMTKVVSLKATVTDFQFVNPHTLINFTVKDDSGERAEYERKHDRQRGVDQRMPDRLDQEQLADWRAGRNAVYQLAALTIGARLAVADA